MLGLTSAFRFKEYYSQVSRFVLPGTICTILSPSPAKNSLYYTCLQHPSIPGISTRNPKTCFDLGCFPLWSLSSRFPKCRGRAGVDIACYYSSIRTLGRLLVKVARVSRIYPFVFASSNKRAYQNDGRGGVLPISSCPLVLLARTHPQRELFFLVSYGWQRRIWSGPPTSYFDLYGVLLPRLRFKSLRGVSGVVYPYCPVYLIS